MTLSEVKNEFYKKEGRELTSDDITVDITGDGVIIVEVQAGGYYYHVVIHNEDDSFLVAG